MIEFQVTLSEGGHRFLIEQKIPTHGEKQLSVYLPIWIPGSYTRRDFSRFLSHLTIRDSQGNPVHVEMENPSRWVIDVPECEYISLSYRVYGRDISVRGCYLDGQRGIFNPCCAALAVAGRENESHKLRFNFNPARQNWKIYGADVLDDGYYHFEDYHHLIDSPFMFGEKIDFAAAHPHGVKHFIAITGAEHWPYELTQLTADVEKICQAAIDFFGELPSAVKNYYFFLFNTENTYGGLEHRSSTMLMSPRNLLPLGKKTKKYHQLLGLFSHEYFHTWNIKDLKPAIYQPYDLEREQPSELLWLFEGFTAYFDNWLLANSKVISHESYFKLLCDDITSYLNRPGRNVQTLAQSSFEAWTKLYNGGEDASNISTTYYVQGAMHALCLDVFLQKATNQELNLAKVMRKLWQDYHMTGEGMTEEKFITTVINLLPVDAHDDFRQFLHTYLHTTEPLPLASSLHYLGIILETAIDNPNYSMGFQAKITADGYRVTSVVENSSAAKSGLAVNDLIIAINGYQAQTEVIQRFLQVKSQHNARQLHIFRDGMLHEIEFELDPPAADKQSVKFIIDTQKQAVREKWLNL